MVGGRFVWGLLTTTVAAGILAVLLWGILWSGAMAAPAGGMAQAPGATPAPPTAPAAGPAPTRTGVAGAVPEPMAPPSTEAESGCGPLDTMLERLRQTVTAQWVACQAQDGAETRALEQVARRRLAALQRCHRDHGMRVLERLAALPVPPGKAPPDGEWHVMTTILHCSLRLSWQQRHAFGDRNRCRELTGAILAVAAQDPDRAHALGAALLADQPYLGLPHEGAVLQMVERAVQQPGFAAPAGKLLRTLWTNLEERGERPSEQLEATAMLYLEDANPVRRRSACVHLFLHGDPADRELVLAGVLRRRDAELAAELALAAAEHLRGRQAVLAVERVAELAGQEVTGAAARLAMHSPAALRHSYEQHLADGSRPGLRAHWVTGGALLPSPEGIQLARLAAERDPDPVVRERAMLALTAQGTAELADQALRRVLSGAAGEQAPVALSAVLFGLRNALGAGHRNLVLRFAAELGDHPAMTAPLRQRLVELQAAATR